VDQCHAALAAVKAALVRIDGAGSTHKVIEWPPAADWPSPWGSCSRRTPLICSDFSLRCCGPRPRRPRRHPRRRLGRRAHRPARPDRLAGGMRVAVRKERPHPGAELRLEDVDGVRITAFATNTVRGQLADLELRHRRRARCGDHIRVAKAFPEPGRLEVPPPARETCCWLPLPSTASGALSFRWPPKSPPGFRCSPAPTTRPAGGSRRSCATGPSLSLRPSPAAEGASGCTCPPGHTGPT